RDYLVAGFSFQTGFGHLDRGSQRKSAFAYRAIAPAAREHSGIPALTRAHRCKNRRSPFRRRANSWWPILRPVVPCCTGLFEAARFPSSFPGESMNEVFLECESKIQSYARSFPAIFKRARGTELWDVEGKRYLDFLAGAGSLNYGHNHPKLKEALIEHIA